MSTRHARRSAAGFTLIEIVLSVALAAVVLSGAILIQGISQRSRGVTALARALQTAMLVQERISDDLLRLVLVEPAPLGFSPDRPSRLGFYAFDPDGPRGREVPVRAVVYALDNPPALLKREWAGQTQTVGVAPLTALSFRPFLSPTGPLVRVSLTVGRDPGDPAGRPVSHSFLARVCAPRLIEPVEVRVLTAFLTPGDGPSDPMRVGP